MESQQDGRGNPEEPNVSLIRDVEVLFNLLKTIPLTTAGQYIESLLGEIRNLRTQAKFKDDEVTRLTHESHKMQVDRNASFEVLLDANHRAKKNCIIAEQQVEDLNKHIHELEMSLTDERKSKITLEKQYKDLDSAFTQEKQKVAQGRDECKKKEKILEEKESLIDKLKIAGSEARQKLTGTKKHNKTLEGALEALKSKMTEKDAKLDKLESFRTPYQEINEEEMFNKYDEIWDLAVNEISQHLEVDPAYQNLTVHRVRPKLLALTSPYNIPLPCSNSNAAKQMRLISILALLAREIDNQIFQPTFFISRESGIRERLLKMAMTDAEKESYCRLTLLSIGTANMDNNLDERIKNVTKNISSCIDDIYTNEQCSKISLSVKKVTQRAAEVWQTFQRTKDKYEAVFEVSQSEIEGCAPFDFLTNEPERGEETTNLPNTSPFIIFPQLSRYEGSVSWICCEAIGIHRSAPQFREAEKEQMAATLEGTLEALNSRKLDKLESFRTSYHGIGSLQGLLDLWVGFAQRIGLREIPPRPGYRRIRWKCACGDSLYDDFIELSPGSLKELENSLNQNSLSSGATPENRGKFNSSFISLTGLLSFIRSFYNTSKGAGSSLPTCDSPQVSAASRRQGARTPFDAMYLLVCVDSGSFGVKLYNELLHGVYNDRSLFTFMREVYQRRRGVRCKLTLRSIQSVNLIKFTLDKSEFVDIRWHDPSCATRCDCLPPSDKVEPAPKPEYRCSPVPALYTPPIGEKYLMHYLRHPDLIDLDQQSVYRQVPKRLCGQLLAPSDGRIPGWGVHFREDLNWQLVWALVLTIFVGGSLLFGILWAVLKKDTQTAFTISAYSITASSVLLGYITSRNLRNP